MALHCSGGGERQAVRSPPGSFGARTHTASRVRFARYSASSARAKVSSGADQSVSNVAPIEIVERNLLALDRERRAAH